MSVKNRFNVFYTLLYECKLKIIQMEKLTKEENKKFYDWLNQFIAEAGYETYYNPTDGGDYRILTTDGKVFYQSTYEYNDWIEIKIDEFKQIHNF